MDDGDDLWGLLPEGAPTPKLPEEASMDVSGGASTASACLGVPVGSASETLYTCLQHLAEDGIAKGRDKPGKFRITASGSGPVKDINECQNKVEGVLLAKQGWPTGNAWNKLKSVLNIPSNGKCSEGERAERLRAIAEEVGVTVGTPSSSSAAVSEDENWDGFFRGLHADFPTHDPEQSATDARTRLMIDLDTFRGKHPNFKMRYGSKGAKEANDFTSLWIPRVFARVLLWLSALETCIKRETGSFKQKTVRNAANRVLSRWYQWFDADGLEDRVADRFRYRVPPFTLGNETEGAGGEKRGAPVSVCGLGGTAGTGQQAKQRRTGGVNVGGLAESTAVPEDDIGDGGMPVLPGEAGDNADGTAGLTGLPYLPFSRSLDNPTAPTGAANSPDGEAEMANIMNLLPDAD